MNGWTKNVIALVAIVGGGLVAEYTLADIISDTAWRLIVMLAMVNVVVALSLNVINGMAGQFSIGHAGFVGIGAYTAAIVGSHLHKSFGGDEYLFANSFIVMPVSILAAAIVAGFFGLIVGLPSLRLKGDYLAIVTLGFSEIFRLLIATASTGGESTGIAKHLSNLGGQQGYGGPDDIGIAQYAGPFWIVGGMLSAIVIAWRLKFSGWGRTLRALREDEIAASAVGVDPMRYKVTSFVISAMGGGIAGAMMSAMRDGSPTVQPDTYNFQFSFDAITMVILGGSGSVSGAILGGIFVTVTVRMIEMLQRLDAVEAFRVAHPDFDLNALRMVVYAGVLILLMIFNPRGIFGENEIFGWGGRKNVPNPKKAEAT